MSLSANAAAFSPAAATLPATPSDAANAAVAAKQTQPPQNSPHHPNTARDSSHRGRGGRGGGGGGGRGRGGRGGISATDGENLHNAVVEQQGAGRGGQNKNQQQQHHTHPHHQQQQQQQQHNHHGQRGGRGGGGGGRGGRGGRGGGGNASHNNNTSHHHHHQQSHRGSGSSSDAAMSPEDAAAIEAALLDHPPPASVSAQVSRSTSASSSSAGNTNLTRELLGFRYEPTTLQRDRYLNRPKQNPRGKTAPTFNKHVYMQANHHFLLGSDDPASFLLPDHQVDWTKVELVVCPVDNAERDCPICLSPPTVAKITRCGHVFCFSCILHYLSLSDRSWSRCPLCFDAVYPQALKSVEFRVHRKFKEGDSIEFVLMRRFKDCVNAVPVEGNANDFSRIRLTTDISSILQREFTELFTQRESYVEAGTTDDLALGYLDNCESQMVARMNEWSHSHPYWVMKSPTYEQMKQQQLEKFERIRQQKQKVAERAKSILGKEEAWPELPPASKPSKPAPATTVPAAAAAAASSTSSTSSSTAASSSSSSSAPTPVTASPPVTSAAKSSSFFDEGEEAAEYRFNKMKIEREKQQQAAAAAASPITPTPANPTSSPSAPTDVYYFYQSSDGQQLYLHSLAYRSLLLNCNNDLSKLPTRIQGKASYLDAYVIDANIRAKFRFLSHLPLTATFQLGLVDIHHYVSKETMQQMKPEYEADKKQRQTAARKQKELNKRSIQSSKALAASNAATGAGPNALSAAAYRNWQLEQDVQSFPDLPANPLGLASAATSLTPTTRSPDLKPSVVNWNTVAEKGLASSELWAPLGATTVGAAAAPAPHWGASAAPLASGSAPWGRSLSQSSAASDKAEAEPEFPTPTVNRNGLTTLLSTGSKRSYR